MCETCKCGYGHLHGCPEALPERGIYSCEACGEAIYDGEKYFNIQNRIYCEYCLEDMSYDEILKLCGIEGEVANYDT